MLADVRRAAPDLLTSFSEVEAVTLFFQPESADADYVAPGDLLQLPPQFNGFDVLIPEFIARTEALGLPIHAWIINEPAEMGRLLDLGVRGLMTDFPARGREAVDARRGGD